MKKTALIVMVITILSKIFGFVRDITLSYYYGTSGVSDAYLIGLTIPGTIFAFVGAGIATSYIPVFSSIEEREGSELANLFTNNIVNLCFIICTVILFLGESFAVPIVKIFASGFEGKTLELAVGFTRISMFGIYFSGMIYIYNGFLQIRNNFIVPALSTIPLNIVIVASIAISFKYNVYILSVGSVFAIVTQLVFIIPALKKNGYEYKFTLNNKNKDLSIFFSLALPVIIGVSVDQINILIDRTLASQIIVGGISALNYANRLNGFIQGIFVLSISTVMYPTISKLSAEKNYEGLKSTAVSIIGSINLLVIPASLGAMILSKPIVQILFARGAFDTGAVELTSKALFFYSIGMFAFGLREVLSRVFYSLHDTKTPTLNAALSMVLNIVLNIILSKYMGISGLALATSISAIFCIILLLINLNDKLGKLDLLKMFESFLKVIFSSLIMALSTLYAYNIMCSNFRMELSLLLSIVVGIVVYSTMVFLLKVEEVENLTMALKLKLGIN